jgi:multisubunit Na+/H+ antiporter MnhC subunit
MSDERRQVFDGAEVLDGVPVLCDNGHHVEPQRPAGMLTPAVVQTAAVVGAGVAAGAAAVAIVHRRKARRLARRRRRMLGPVLASRSFLVDVHVLGDRK